MVCVVNSVNGSFHSSHFRMSWRFVFRCFIVRVKRRKNKENKEKEEGKRRRRFISSKLSGEAVRAQQSRALALAGCDCSERQRRKSFHALRTLFSSFSDIFVFCQVRGHLVRLATTSSAFPPKDAETMRRARSRAGPR